MKEFYENNDTLHFAENAQRLEQQMALDNAIGEVSPDTELSKDEMSWITELFERIFKPIIDLFHLGEGIDEETITVNPADDTTEGTDNYRLSDATEQWHLQETDHTCAVCVQQFIINELTGLDISEQTLSDIAYMEGWLTENGTNIEDTGNLLEVFGIDTLMNYEGQFSDLKDTLETGGRVLVCVDSGALWTEGYGNYPIYGPDHAIEVIGLDESDPDDVRVIINDSGIDNGCGRSVALDDFMEAWQASGGFMVSAYPMN